MSALPKPRRLTEAEYLAVEDAAPYKSEFFNGEVFAMAGAGPEHNIVNENLTAELGSRLKGGPCRTLSRDQRVKVEATGLYTYPDLIVVCGPRQYAGNDPKSLVNPTVLVEVLSPSTAEYDRGPKFRQYQRLPSVREIVFVSQDAPAVEGFARQAAGRWLLSTVDDPAGEFVLESVPVRVPLADLYRDVEVPPPPAPLTV